MKKYSWCIAWGLTGVWVFYTLIHIAVAILQLNAHHNFTTYMLKKKVKKNFVSFVISKNNKNFVRVNKKECLWQNEWYDIVHCFEKDGFFYITAYPDKKEEVLHKNLNEALAKHQDNGKAKITKKFELKETYTNNVKFNFIPPFCSEIANFYTISNLQNPYLSLPVPPPKG